MTFGPNLYYTGGSWFGATGGNVTALNNYTQNCCPCFSPTDIFFSSAVRGAAFQFDTNLGVSTFTALLGGNVVYAFSGTTDSNGTVTVEWYGFDSTIAFDQINIQSGGSSTAFILDNLQIGEAVVTTPEPASMTLVATALVGIFGLARRRRNLAAV